MMKRILLNLPLIIGLLIMVGFSADLPFLRPLKTETTFGWWVVVMVPVAVFLLITQIVLWCTVPASRPLRRGA